MAGTVSQAAAKPLKVYILAGQSNMQGHANVSTFDSMAADPKTAPILKEMRGAEGKPRVCQKVWISSIGCAGEDTTEQKGLLTTGFGASPAEIGPEYDPKQGYELAGFVWFQGFNDMVSGWTYDKSKQPGGYDLYAQLLAQFIRDMRKDLSAPKLPFVIGVIGIGGEKEDKKPGGMQYFRQAMAAPSLLPEFKGNGKAFAEAMKGLQKTQRHVKQ